MVMLNAGKSCFAEREVQSCPDLHHVDALQGGDATRCLLVPIVSQAQLPVTVVAPAVGLQRKELPLAMTLN